MYSEVLFAYFHDLDLEVIIYPECSTCLFRPVEQEHQQSKDSFLSKEYSSF